MSETVIMGKLLDDRHPGLRRELSRELEVILIDVLRFGESIDRLAGRSIAVSLVKSEHLNFAVPFKEMLKRIDADVQHWVMYDDEETPLTQAQLRRLGFTEYIDMSRTMHEVSRQITHVARSPRPERIELGDVSLADWMEDESASRRALDAKIARLVAYGLSDQEIAEILNYRHQTIRNRVSKMLGDFGLKNRTELSLMALRSSFYEMLDVNPRHVDNPEPDHPHESPTTE